MPNQLRGHLASPSERLRIIFYDLGVSVRLWVVGIQTHQLGNQRPVLCVGAVEAASTILGYVVKASLASAVVQHLIHRRLRAKEMQDKTTCSRTSAEIGLIMQRKIVDAKYRQTL